MGLINIALNLSTMVYSHMIICLMPPDIILSIC